MTTVKIGISPGSNYDPDQQALTDGKEAREQKHTPDHTTIRISKL